MLFAPVPFTFNVALSPTSFTLILTYTPLTRVKLLIAAVNAVDVPEAVANNNGSIKYDCSLVIYTA
jgi:hypothetical protein